MSPPSINVQIPASLAFGTITSDKNFISNVGGAYNFATISAPVENSGQTTANGFTKSLVIKNVANEDISSQFTISETDSVAEIANGAPQTLTWTVTTKNPESLEGLDKAEVGISYGDQNDGTIRQASSTPTDVFTVDNTLPTLPTVTIASNNSSTTMAKIGDIITLTFAAIENVQTPTVTIAGNTAIVTGSNQNWTATYTMAGTEAETVIPFTINFSDLANNAGMQVTSTVGGSSVTFDKTLPIITIAPYNTDPTNQDITVTASTNEGTLNATSHTFTANGSFDFVATDEAGNATTQTVTITNIDKIAPSVSSYTFDGSAQNVWFNPHFAGIAGEVDIVVNANEPVKFNRVYVCLNSVSTCDETNDIKYFEQQGNYELAISRTWEGNASGGSVIVPDEIYKLGVKITDEAGNITNSTLTSYTITVDTVSPVINPHSDITAYVASQISSVVDYDLPTITDADNSVIPTCDPISGSTFPYGTTTVTCNATDTAGNIATSTTFTVTVTDNVSPDLSITGFTADSLDMLGNLTDGYILNTNNNIPVPKEILIQFKTDTSVNETLRNEYFGLKLISSTVNASDLKTYYDERGVPEPFLTYLKNAVDGNNPFVYINGTTIKLVDAARHDILGGADTDMAIPDNYPLGTYIVEGKIKDIAGNEKIVTLKLIIAGSATVPTATVSYDVIIPTHGDVIATITPSEPLQSGELTHTFTENGSHTFNFVSQRRTAGSVIATVANIDKVVPTANAGSDVLAKETFTQTGTATDNVAIASVLWEKVSGPGDISFGATTSPVTTITADTDGVYEIKFTATDTAGNSTIDTMQLTWDATKPTVTLSKTGHDDLTVKEGDTVQIHANWSEEMKSAPTVSISNTGISNVTMTNSGGNEWIYDWTVTAGPDGSAVVTAAGEDLAGNAYDGADEIGFYIDNTDPVILIVSPSAETHVNGTTAFNFTDSEPNLPECSVDGTNWSACSPGVVTFGSVTDFGSLPQGTFTLKITDTDVAGNSTTTERQFVKDTILPTVASVSPVKDSLGIDTGANIVIHFSEPVNFDASNIEITSSTTPAVTVFAVTGSGTNTITVNPDELLANNTRFGVKISAVPDLAGNFLLNDKNWLFTTKTNYSINLYNRGEGNGWNLISLPVVPPNTNIATVLGSAGESINSVWTYNPSDPNSATSDGWLTYDPSADPNASNLTTMTAGFGYWIDAKENTSIAGTGSLIPTGPVAPPQRTLKPGWNLVGYYQLPGESQSTLADTLGGLYSYMNMSYGYNNESGNAQMIGDILPGDAMWVSFGSDKDNYYYMPSRF
ncbi:MAG: Ig-like domain-containing protein [Candidatus Paceibacterota bacterium]